MRGASVSGGCAEDIGRGLFLARAGLDHAAGAQAGAQPPRRNPDTHTHDTAVAVEPDEAKREAHPEGVKLGVTRRGEAIARWLGTAP